MPSPVHVAVGVVLDKDQRILIARRAEHTHQGGLWEFPGGKVEPTETVQFALCRELKEELGIESDLSSLRSLIEINHHYIDKSVLLDVWWVDSFSGTPQGLEGQPICWVKAAELRDYNFPEANQLIIKAVQKVLG
jgi:8-oxo-dGTP diphosphatase